MPSAAGVVQEGGREPAHVFDLDNAEAAAAIGRHLGMVAEGWDMNAMIPEDFEHRLPVLSLDFLPRKILAVHR